MNAERKIVVWSLNGVKIGFAVVESGSAEWHRMWASLEKLYGDTIAMNDGEAWQYLGTFQEPHCSSSPWRHEFRHRDHPVHGRLYVTPEVSQEFADELRAYTVVDRTGGD